MPLIRLSEAIALLQQGQLVAIPTETVYGLAADARNPAAVQNIFALKGRPPTHPLIVHTTDPDMVAQTDPRAQLLVREFWPGPLTLVLRRKWGKAAPIIGAEVTGGKDTIAVRAPAHPLSLQLIREVGPLAAPSANRFGQVSPTCAEHVLQSFPDLPVLDGGPCTIGLESTILDLTQEIPALLRPGGLPESALSRWLGPLSRHSTTAAPGTLPAHYAPRTRLILSSDAFSVAMELRKRGERVALLGASPEKERARDLYALLRSLDSGGYSCIVAEPSEEEGLGTAINDRLRRAAASF